VRCTGGRSRERCGKTPAAFSDRPGPLRGVVERAGVLASKRLILCEAADRCADVWWSRDSGRPREARRERFDDQSPSRKSGTDRNHIAIMTVDDAEPSERRSRLRRTSLARGIECFPGFIPEGHGRNEYALQVTPSAKSPRDCCSAKPRFSEISDPRSPYRAATSEENHAAAKEKITDPITTAATPTVPLGPDKITASTSL